MPLIFNLKDKIFLHMDNVICITFDLTVGENKKKKRNATIYFVNSRKPLTISDEDGGRILYNRMRHMSVRVGK